MSKMIKKVFLIALLVTITSLTLVGCGNKVTEEMLKNLSYSFEDTTLEYSGEPQSIFIDNPYEEQGVEITYKDNENTYPGEYTVTAIITYEDIEVRKSAKLTITKMTSVLEAEANQTIYLSGNMAVAYTLNNDRQRITMLDEQGEKVDLKYLTEEGTYNVEIYAPEATFYKESNHVKVTLTIVKSLYDITFESQEVIADGTEKTLEVTGDIPAGFTVEYENNKGTEDGTYFAKAFLKNESGEVVETHCAVLTIDNPENEAFAEYLDEFFVTYLEDDQLSVNIFCENPEDFGLEHYEAEWYAFEPFGDKELAEDKALFDELLDELHAYKDAELNDYQELAYNNVEAFLEHYVALYNIDDSSFMNVTYVDQFGGYVADFGTYMEAYSLRTEQEVKDIVSYIKSTKEAFPSYLEFVKTKSEKGYGLSDYTITEMRNYLKDVLDAGDGYYLVDVLTQKVDKLTFLSGDQKADYKQQIVDGIKNYFIPGVQELYDGLETYLGKVSTEDEGYWAKYERGKELYTLTLKNLLGYEDLNMEEYIKEVDEVLKSSVNKVINTQGKIVSAYNISTWEELESVLAKNSILNGTPEEMVTYLKEFAKTIVPDLQSEPEIFIKEMDVASAKVSNAVAYYMKSALDNTGGEYITLNPVKLGDSAKNDVLSTMAHEGYPGHLYAYVYSKELDLPNISTIMTSTAHGEGWATYVQLELFEYAKEQSDDANFDMIMDYLYANQLSGHLLETRIDVGVHYEGWTVADIASYMNNLGYSPDSAQEIYNLIIETPTQYASYGYGKLVFYNMHQEAQETLCGFYDKVEFNEMLLSSGWVNLQELEEIYEEYMEAKCFECGIVWK